MATRKQRLLNDATELHAYWYIHTREKLLDWEIRVCTYVQTVASTEFIMTSPNNNRAEIVHRASEHAAPQVRRMRHLY